MQAWFILDDLPPAGLSFIVRVCSPVGFVKAGDRLEKDPDRRVQEAITLVFDKVAELGSARQALLWFLEHGLDCPQDTTMTT